MDKIKLAIAEPHVSERIHTDFHRSWVRVQSNIPISWTYYTPEKIIGGFAENISTIRNQFAKRAVVEKITHLLMIDTDQIYPADTVIKLLKLAGRYRDNNVGAIGGLVHERTPPYNPIALVGEKGAYRRVTDEKLGQNKVVEVDATGTGCLLFDVRVFGEDDFPWFHNEWATDKQTGKKTPVGEDINFCSKMRKKGWRILIDSSLQIGHIASLVVDTNIRQAYKGWIAQKYNQAQMLKE